MKILNLYFTIYASPLLGYSYFIITVERHTELQMCSIFDVNKYQQDSQPKFPY